MPSRGWSLPAAAILLWQSAIAVASPTPNLDTLFYSPIERQKVVRARLSPPDPGSQAQEQVQSPATHAQLSGVVRRAAGKGTVWVNGVPWAEGTLKAGQIHGMDAVIDGHRLRVGQSYDKSTDVSGDVVQPGAVTVQQRRP